LKTECGWDKGHIHASELGGSDDLSNLQAQHWETNEAEGSRIASMARILRAAGLLSEK
jgi:hypothetical protein